ncbi:MAG: 1-acylglycerol-3-phosphate O-acyltransferase [Aquabacterium sp.]|uniref:1-acylglycerol-3-phosphate O-acyltransferase n=1 Tax=Aquabacterium sp. TaxID=1872578 RepID=UPI001B4248ED|nr:1-acylglycerol-3-phosphate O-acyltransferase [Aquabacterium sp.]MBP7133183.1 1-acylglycerol-3-phosphate O-acyltransferase [Aquabacterium sp.]MBP9063110.1 1-acylglycerol-3-phosphate O-acyltransferase [Aquabacterium sp.]MDQ5925908.1 1-acyl-sn-glycerol-3-phosphate acyltransferase [Pseudomonadota bacterium]
MLLFLRMFVLTVHFVIASVIGLLIGLCRPFNPDNSRLCARVYGIPAMKIMGLKVKLEDETVRDHTRSAVIVANHISNYDLMVFGLTVPRRTVSLGKKSLKWIPLFGQLYWLAGNVLVDRGNAVRAKKAMLTTTDTLQHKDMSLWVFAEGTRGHGRGLQPLKKGAFLMAINAGVPIIPICGNNYVRGMNLNRWHSGNAIIRSLAPMPTKGMTAADLPALMAECQSRMAACIDELDRQAGTLKA